MNQSTQLTEPERLALVVEIWKKTVEVQQHFNDIELRIRNIAITVLGAALGAAAFSLKEGLTIAVIGIEILAGKLIVAAALFAWLAFYFMDRFWYHRLLKGAVNLGIKIEESNKGLLPEIDLSSEIKKISPVSLFGKELHSNQKIDVFYLSFAAVLLAALFVLGGPPSAGEIEQIPRDAVQQPIVPLADERVCNAPVHEVEMKPANEALKDAFNPAKVNKSPGKPDQESGP